MFTSDYSIGKSILPINPYDAKSPISDKAPVSISAIAKEYSINPTFLVEKDFSGFAQTYNIFSAINTQFVFGLKLVTVRDINEKNESSFPSESDIVIFISNSDGYKDCIKIYSKAATEGKYYVPRISWDILCKMWTENLTLAIPFYDGFIHKNLMSMGQCVPRFPAKPIFFQEEHGLPFDCLLSEALESYCKANSFIIQKTHSIFYYKNSDIKAYQTFRCINSRNILNKPNMEFFGSDQFSFESYLQKIGQKLK